MIEKPDYQTIALQCKACGHIWDDWLPIRVRIDVACAALEAFHCRGCGAGADKICILVGAGEPVETADLKLVEPTKYERNETLDWDFKHRYLG